jgi:hypothetical protein
MMSTKSIFLGYNGRDHYYAIGPTTDLARSATKVCRCLTRPKEYCEGAVPHWHHGSETCGGTGKISLPWTLKAPVCACCALGLGLAWLFEKATLILSEIAPRQLELRKFRQNTLQASFLMSKEYEDAQILREVCEEIDTAVEFLEKVKSGIETRFPSTTHKTWESLQPDSLQEARQCFAVITRISKIPFLECMTLAYDRLLRRTLIKSECEYSDSFSESIQLYDGAEVRDRNFQLSIELTLSRSVSCISCKFKSSLLKIRNFTLWSYSSSCLMAGWSNFARSFAFSKPWCSVPQNRFWNGSH